MKTTILTATLIIGSLAFADANVEYRNLKFCALGLGATEVGDDAQFTVEGEKKIDTFLLGDESDAFVSAKGKTTYWSHYSRKDQGYMGLGVTAGGIGFGKVLDATAPFNMTAKDAATALGPNVLKNRAIASQGEKIKNTNLMLEMAMTQQNGLLDPEEGLRIMDDLALQKRHLDSCKNIPDENIKQAAAIQKEILDAHTARVETLIKAANQIGECAKSVREQYQLAEPLKSQQ